MNLINGADAAYPGNPLPAGTQILAAYVGATDLPGPPDTPHIWTRDEWNQYLDPESALYGGPDLRVLPIYVHDYPGDPAVLAQNAVDAVTDLGWAAGIGRLLVVDLETLVDPAYVSGLNQEVSLRGFRLCKYGSYSTINQNSFVYGGTWGALWVTRKPTILPPGTVGQQWHPGELWDLDVFSPFVYDNCGRGLRRSVP